jgi:SAM-dependent methyltransferase
MLRASDGSAGDANYGTIGKSYASYRQPEPSIFALIDECLGNAKTVLNVGAGAGSYEPVDRDVTAVEPSASMRAQRPAHLVAAIDAVAEKLPFPDKHFDASMGTFTVHQWPSLDAGLAEMRRVTRGPVLILTCDPDEVQNFWLNDYAPDVLSAESRRYPSMDAIQEGFGTDIEIIPVPIPLECRDGFNEAYYGRPEMLLDDLARLSCSAWSFVESSVSAAYIERLKSELRSGEWDERYGHLRTEPEYYGSLYLVVSPG